ncbi:uroporphyrinogen decarboxylase (URO-D) [Blautia liquoris]|uniref:Uroporphyrinogen decarboxylase (URO-D) n=1 Tax=Blautia liquoris TaxID=2779518 RepID=A0A7M2RJ37_9FIRM|nr:uroporphyrinogen decarboxylase family protein [Blautia liquoris]QOV20315.1 uroporphyrinogen decarboxylase (URO-D) [Blautia liquoris]
MMTARENYLALCNGKKPERLVNQYEPFEFVLRDPLLYDFYFGCYIEGQDTLNPFGVTIRWKKGEHAGMPYVTEKTKVIQDVTEWKKYIKMPGLEHTEEEWAAAKEDLAKIDRKEKLATGLMVSGIFETAHSLMGFEDTLMNFLLEPEAMNELFDYLFEFKMEYAKQLLDHLELDVILSHDDWGGKDRLFFSKDVFDEFLKPRYEKLYGYITSRGVQVVHRSDSWCESIVPDMVDIHVTTWQGVLPGNNILKLQKELDGKLILMGGIDSIIDMADWKEEVVRKEARRACEEYGPGGGFIPSITYGLPESIFPGVFECITDEISRYNEEHKC